MRFTTINLGCKVNAFEAEAVAEQLEKQGWERMEDPKADTDAVLIFTCAVTNTAAAKSRKSLHQAMRMHPEAIKAVAGCYAQIDDGLLEEADIIAGTAHKKDLPDLLKEFERNHQKIRRVDDLGDVRFDTTPVDHLDQHSRGVLKVQDGCNQFCSYCVIPYARGRERSLEPDRVIAEAKQIAMHHSEIVLTGIHTGRYGREYGVSLASLMERILREVPQLKRLRVSSIEMTEVTDQLIALMKREPRIARHLHIPLQAGSDAILKAMRRPYDTAAYYAKIEEIRKEIPDIAISCDLMTGFPGETEELFEESYAFLKKCRFSFLHVFPFSLRDGTRAASMPCQIDVSVRKQRANKCIALSKQMQETYAASWVGQPVEVITEKPQDGCTPGHTSQYVQVKILDTVYPRGSLVRFVPERCEDGVLTGRESSLK